MTVRSRLKDHFERIHADRARRFGVETQRDALAALNRTRGDTIFQGFDADDRAAFNRIARRRAKNKVARASRRTNR